MTRAIRFHKPGGPEVLVWEERDGARAHGDLTARKTTGSTVLLV